MDNRSEHGHIVHDYPRNYSYYPALTNSFAHTDLVFKVSKKILKFYGPYQHEQILISVHVLYVDELMQQFTYSGIKLMIA